MARRKKDIAEKYNAPFPLALRHLMDERSINQETLAIETGKTRQTISQYVNGISEPGYDTLVKIANFFNVSTDYLLGISETKTQNQSIQDIVNQLGLPENIVNLLIAWNSIEASAHRSLEETTALERDIINIADALFPMNPNRYTLSQKTLQMLVTYFLNSLMPHCDPTDRTYTILSNFYLAESALTNNNTASPATERDLNEFTEAAEILEKYGLVPMSADDVGIWYLDHVFKSIKIRIHNSIINNI